MKPGTAQGPASSTRAARPTTSDEEIEVSQRQAELHQRTASRMSKVAQMLSANYYVTDWTHPCLLFASGEQQLSVSEYYPDVKVAIDKFYSEGKIDAQRVEFKKKALKKLGIRYGMLRPGMNLADLYTELDLEG